MMVKCAIVLFTECAVFAVQGQQKLKKVNFLCNSSPCAPAKKELLLGYESVLMIVLFCYVLNFSVSKDVFPCWRLVGYSVNDKKSPGTKGPGSYSL